MRDTAQRVAEVLAEIGRILLLRLAGGQSVTWCVADHVMDSPPQVLLIDATPSLRAVGDVPAIGNSGALRDKPAGVSRATALS
jgi:hypothetical protein